MREGHYQKVYILIVEVAVAVEANLAIFKRRECVILSVSVPRELATECVEKYQNRLAKNFGRDFRCVLSRMAKGVNRKKNT